MELKRLRDILTSSEQSLRTLFVPWRRAYTSFEKEYKKCGSGSTLPRTFQHEIKQKIKLVFRKTEPLDTLSMEQQGVQTQTSLT